VLKALGLFFILLVGGMIALYGGMQNGSVLRFLDGHPDSRWVPAAQYGLAQGYYFFQDLPEAATYFIRIPTQYPSSSLADDAYFNYLECLDDMASVPRAERVERSKKYLQQFPGGKHAASVQNRLEAYQMGSR